MVLIKIPYLHIGLITVCECSLIIGFLLGVCFKKLQMFSSEWAKTEVFRISSCSCVVLGCTCMVMCCLTAYDYFKHGMS